MQNYTFSKTYKRNNHKKLILIVDDDKNIRFVLKTLFEKNNYEVETTGNLAGLRRLVNDIVPDLIITDVKLPDGSFFDEIIEIKKQYVNLPIIIISAFSTLSTAVKAVRHGAFEFISKPFDIKIVLQVTENAFDQLNADRKKLKNIENIDFKKRLIGRSEQMHNIYHSMSKLIGNNLSVLITGESGTGKDLIAKAIHELSNKNENFYKINLSTVNINTIEKKLSNLILANSTIYIDNINETNISFQSHLLNILRNTFSKIQNENIKNLRFIVSSRENLIKLIEKGKFREDLFYYLNIIPLFIPPLIDRKEDIKELADNFLVLNKINNLPIKTMSNHAYKELENYSWPGNVKELETFINRLAILAPGKVINSNFIKNELNKVKDKLNIDFSNFSEIFDLELEKFFTNTDISKYSDGLYNYLLRKLEKSLIRKTLSVVNGNQIKASRLLGLNRNTLRKKIIELNIEIIKKVKNWTYLIVLYILYNNSLLSLE